MLNKEKKIYELFNEFFNEFECGITMQCHPVIYEQKNIIESDMSWEEKEVRFNACTTLDYKKDNDAYIFNYDEKIIQKRISEINQNNALDNLTNTLITYIEHNKVQKEYARKLKEKQF